MKKINKKIAIIIFYVIWLLIVLTYFCYNSDYNLMLISWISNISYIILITCIYFIKKDIFDFSIIFMTFIFLFCYGQVFLYSLGVNTETLRIFIINTQEEIIKATTYFILSFLFMGLGILITCKKNMNTDKKISKYYNNAIKYVGLFLLMISIVPYFYKLFKDIILTRSNGYIALYQTENISTSIPVVGYIFYFFIPSLIMLLYSYRDEKLKRNIILFKCLIVIVGKLLIGGRGTAISIIATIILFYHIYIRKIKGKNFIKLLIIAIIVATIIPVIGKIRDKNYTFRRSN